MSGFYLFNSNGGGAPVQPANADFLYENLSHPDDGLLLSGASANVMNSTYTSLTTPANDLCGVLIEAGAPSSNNARFQINMRLNGSAILVPDYHISPGGGNIVRIFIPINIPANTTVDVAVRSSSANATIRFSAKGVVSNINSGPGFANMAALNVAIGLVRPGTQTIPITDPQTSTWVEIAALSSVEYGAIMPVITEEATPTVVQRVKVTMGYGPDVNNITQIGVPMMGHMGTSAPYIIGFNYPALQCKIPAGNKIWTKASATLATADKLRVGGWVLW